MRVLGAGVTIALVVAAVGCGGGSDGDALRVYSSFDLPGGNSLVRAAQLALDDAEGRAGAFDVELVSMSATASRPGPVDLERVDRNAFRAVRDERAVAYIGDHNSDETALSAVNTNRAGLLQVSPTATYAGLTKTVGAQAGEPERFFPSGKRTFARVIPADDVLAAGLLRAVRQEGLRRVYVLDDRSVYGTGLTKLIRAAADDAGVELVDDARLTAASGTPDGLARAMRDAGIRGLIFAGCIQAPTAQAFHRAGRDLLIVTGDCQTQPAFVQGVRDAGRALRIVSPAPEFGRPQAAEFAKRYEDRYGEIPGPQAYFAYEAMAAVLDAIRRAGERGDDRAAVVKAFFATRARRGVVGDYAIDARGDTTQRTVGTFRIRDRGLVPQETLVIPRGG